MNHPTRIVLAILLCFASSAASADALPSWRDGASKAAIVSFVDRVTHPGDAQFVPQSRRIAVFDNDGTLWAEKPFYFQALFAMDRVAAIARDDPSILSSDALRAAARGDLKGTLADGRHGLMEVVSASHAGMDIEEFKPLARDWLANTLHPDTRQPYMAMIYQPMLELLAYLRDNGFKTYIVSGGGADFIRSFAEDVYGIPPYQVIGSMGNASYDSSDGTPGIVKEPGIFFVDDKAGKPVAISRHLGVRPIFVAGNSDGDFEMLEWGTSGSNPGFGLIVHHTDADREWAYDRESHVGKLNRGLDDGPDRGWLIVDMKRDWLRVFPWQTD